MMRRSVALKAGADLVGFREALRRLIVDDVAPDDVVWSADDAPSLLGVDDLDSAPPLALPRAVVELMQLVVCHRDRERYALLHALVHRVVKGEREILDKQNDALVHRLEGMAKSVRRDLHKMHAFLRFRKIGAGAEERFVAWFEPDHFILEATADFFVERFRSLVWSILTPVGSLHWDRASLVVGPPATRADAPASDDFEPIWRGYYESVFNPARVNPDAMRAEMPKKYWRNLPEAAAIVDMVRSAPQRARDMIEREASMPAKRDPQRAVAAMSEQAPKTLEDLNRLIAAADPLVPGADHAVLGEGPVGAAIAFVGEQPGDQEDLQGRPFVGPAGQLLDRALDEAGVDRAATYVTNAVKHFKFERRGKRRIHQKPTTGEVKHYRWWLMKELELVRPKLVVALGATAVLALAGKALPITRSRGPARFEEFAGYITVHPSYLLRLPDADAKQREYAAFVADMKRVRAMADEAEAAFPSI